MEIPLQSDPLRLDDFLYGAFHRSTLELTEECEHFVLWL